MALACSRKLSTCRLAALPGPAAFTIAAASHSTAGRRTRQTHTEHRHVSVRVRDARNANTIDYQVLDIGGTLPSSSYSIAQHHHHRQLEREQRLGQLGCHVQTDDLAQPVGNRNTAVRKTFTILPSRLSFGHPKRLRGKKLTRTKIYRPPANCWCWYYSSPLHQESPARSSGGWEQPPPCQRPPAALSTFATTQTHTHMKRVQPSDIMTTCIKFNAKKVPIAYK